MPANIMSSFKAFSEKFGVKKKDKGPRAEALKKYFEKGGVISVGKADKDWPRLIYPSPLRIRSQIKELNELKQQYVKKQSSWEKSFNDAKIYHLRNNILKYSEPLYWKHIAKCTTNKDYKNDTALVKLPIHLVPDPRWKPMIRMFVNDVEYRKNLVETVQNSIVYKKDKKVAKYANILQAFRMDISSKKIDSLKKKIDYLDNKIKTLETMLEWAKET